MPEFVTKPEPPESDKVPETGLEPAHVTIPDPKSGASANFATPAKNTGENTRFGNIVAYMALGTFFVYFYLQLKAIVGNSTI